MKIRKTTGRARGEVANNGASHTFQFECDDARVHQNNRLRGDVAFIRFPAAGPVYRSETQYARSSHPPP
jgi:hypothetical protein